MKLLGSVVLISLMLAMTAWAQAPAANPPAAAGAAAPATRVAVIDFNEAVVKTANGKKASDQIQGEITKMRGDFDKEQKKLEDLQEKQKNTQKALSDTELGQIGRDITAAQTNLDRMNQDAQRKIQDLQEELFGPVAQLVKKHVDSYAAEVGLAVVFDMSTQPTNILFANDVADITTEIVRRVDADKTGATPRQGTTAPATPRPTTNPPAAPRPVTPPPAAPKQ